MFLGHSQLFFSRLLQLLMPRQLQRQHTVISKGAQVVASVDLILSRLWGLVHLRGELLHQGRLRQRDTSLQQRAASRGGSVGAVICEGRN